MLFEDTYLTIKETSEALFKDKGSKFLAFAYPVTNEEEIKKAISALQKVHPGANHHCYAYRLGHDKLIFRANDDGEPSNTAGRPILGQIQSKDLTNILIVVVRYFGGTLLGVSGLINAYKQAAAAVITTNCIIEKTINDIYEVKFGYLQMNDIMKLIKDENLLITDQHFELDCSIIFSVRKGNSNNIYDQLVKLPGVTINFLKTI